MCIFYGKIVHFGATWWTRISARFNPPLTHSLTHPLTYSLTHSLTHSLTSPSPIHNVVVLLTVWYKAVAKQSPFSPMFNFFGHQAPVSVVVPDLSFRTHFATVSQGWAGDCHCCFESLSSHGGMFGIIFIHDAMHVDNLPDLIGCVPIVLF